MVSYEQNPYTHCYSISELLKKKKFVGALTGVIECIRALMLMWFSIGPIDGGRDYDNVANPFKLPATAWRIVLSGCLGRHRYCQPPFPHLSGCLYHFDDVPLRLAPSPTLRHLLPSGVPVVPMTNSFVSLARSSCLVRLSLRSALLVTFG